MGDLLQLTSKILLLIRTGKEGNKKEIYRKKEASKYFLFFSLQTYLYMLK